MKVPKRKTTLLDNEDTAPLIDETKQIKFGVSPLDERSGSFLGGPS